MIVRLLETILIGYCIVSYVSCAYVLWASRHMKPETDIPVTSGDRVLGSVIFLIFAPIVIADVIYSNLMGEEE